MNGRFKVVYDAEKKHYRFDGGRLVDHMFNYNELFSSKNDPAFFDKVKSQLLVQKGFREVYKVRDIKGLCIKLLHEYFYEMSKELITGKTFRSPVGNYFEIGIKHYSEGELKVARQNGLLQGFDLFAINYEVPYLQFRSKNHKKKINYKRVGIHKDLYKEFIDNTNKGKLLTGYIDNNELFNTVAKEYEGLLTLKTIKTIIKKGLNKIGYWTSRKFFDLRLTNFKYYFTICNPNYSILSHRNTKTKQWQVKYRLNSTNVHMYIRVNPKKAVEETNALYNAGLHKEKLWVYNGLIPVLTPNTYIWKITISREELVKRFKVVEKDPFKNVAFCLGDVLLTAKEIAIINTEHLYFSKKDVKEYFEQLKKRKQYVSKR